MTAPQAASDRATTPPLGTITHVALTIRDPEVSVPWYRALIGSDPVMDEDTGPYRHIVFALGDTLFALHVFPEGIEDLAFSPRRPGIDHISFAAADRQELQAWEQRLEELGVVHGGIIDAHYGTALSFKDPDGLPLEVFCPPGA
jgi:glyoxylase I family protein